MYKTDGHYFLWRSLAGTTDHPWHLLYPALLSSSLAALAPLGLTAFQAGRVLSGIGMAAGVFLVWAASRALLRERARTVAATLLVAGAPCTMFFATVVELHGPFFAFAGLACLATSRVAIAPSLCNALLLGTSTALAYAAHASGALLPGVLWPILAAHAHERGGGRAVRTLLAPLGVATLAHGALVAAAPWIAQAFGRQASLSQTHTFISDALVHLTEPWLLPGSAWREWLRPYFPLSVVALLAACRRAHRVAGLAFALGLLVLLGATLVLLGEECERGAYLLPAAWPAALLAVRWLPARAWPWLIVAGLALGILEIEHHDARRPARAFAAGFRAVAGSRPSYLLIYGHVELEAMLVHLPEVPFRAPLDEASLDPSLLPRALPLLDRFLDDKLGAGIEVWLTEGARMALASPTWAANLETGPLLLEHFERAYRLEHVEAAGFCADRLLPRD